MDFLRAHYKTLLIAAAVVAFGAWYFYRPTETVSVSVPDESGKPGERTFDIVTLLPPDAIPAIDAPRFLTAREADDEYAPDELVLGVALDGDSRAYSTSYLDRHEIVNDTVAGRKIAVTW